MIEQVAVGVFAQAEGAVAAIALDAIEPATQERYAIGQRRDDDVFERPALQGADDGGGQQIECDNDMTAGRFQPMADLFGDHEGT